METGWLRQYPGPGGRLHWPGTERLPCGARRGLLGGQVLQEAADDEVRRARLPAESLDGVQRLRHPKSAARN